MKDENGTRDSPPAPGVNWTHFLYAGLILLVCVAFYQATQTENLLRKIALSERDNSVLRANLSRSEQEMRKAMVRFHTELASVQEELVTTREQADSSMAKAQSATLYADKLAGRLEKKRREEEKLQQQLSAQLSNVKKSADETSNRLKGISSEVGGVKDSLASVRADATQHTVDLEREHGDLSELKNGVAINSQQIQVLRDISDQDVFEFTLTKSSGPQRIGDIQVRLTRTDEKRNTFTVEIGADDKRIEKRDRTINEPVQFFVTSKSNKPYQLVVNEVGKNTVKGYLAAPKEIIARK
jgi:chromosome segregation ATPase